MAEITLTTSTYDAEVTNSDLPVLIDFFATWCGPCRMLAPIIEEISEECADTLKVCVVDTDREPALAAKFHIEYIPTLVVVKNGTVTATASGFRSKEDVLALINE